MICTTKDNYVTNYQENNASWIVWLYSGLVVYQDDLRPGLYPPSAWERLYYYCHETGDYIKEMQIKFRSNAHRLTPEADGYYFSKGARGALCLPRTIGLFFVGTLNDEVLLVRPWKVPEMMPELFEERDPQKAGICLISKNIPPI
jgi:hypothetical protein